MWASPAGVSLQLVVVLAFTLMLPNIGQLIGKGESLFTTGLLSLECVATRPSSLLPRNAQGSLTKCNPEWRTIKICFKCQINLAKGGTASYEVYGDFTWENIVLIKLFMEYKNIFPKTSKYFKQYVNLDVMRSVCGLSICISVLCCLCLEDVKTKVW